MQIINTRFSYSAHLHNGGIDKLGFSEVTQHISAVSDLSSVTSYILKRFSKSFLTSCRIKHLLSEPQRPPLSAVPS